MLPDHSIQHNIGVFKGVWAYAHGGPDGFNTYMRGSNQPLNGNYVDGVSLTHGSENHHIWTFAATKMHLICSCNGSSGMHTLWETITSVMW